MVRGLSWPENFTFPRADYAKRIGVDLNEYDQGPTLHLLRRLHAAQTSTIPFENTDAFVNRRISLRVDNVCNKLIYAHRGGYCLEVNTLFYAALIDAGFTNSRILLSNTLWMAEINSFGRAHMLELVMLPVEDDDGADDATKALYQKIAITDSVTGQKVIRWLIDASFAARFPQEPMLLDYDGTQVTPGGICRIIRDPNRLDWPMYILQSIAPSRTGNTKSEKWIDMYEFDLQPAEFGDVQMVNIACFTQSVLMTNLLAFKADSHWDETKKRCVQHFLYIADNERVSKKANYGTPARSTHKRFDKRCQSPDELLDWMADNLDINFNNAKYPQYAISKEVFAQWARKKLKAFGGTGYDPKAHL